MVLKEPLPPSDLKQSDLKQGELKHFDGVIARAANDAVTVEITPGKEVTFPLEQVDHANLKFEW